jgi:hypothetical protein
LFGIDRRRRALLAAALGFSAIHWRAPVPPVAIALATWLDSWRGVGAVVGGMRRLGYEVEMKQFPMAWRVNFRKRGGEYVVGSAWETTAWRAVQRSACEVLSK